jgi:hypothetical protein
MAFNFTFFADHNARLYVSGLVIRGEKTASGVRLLLFAKDIQKQKSRDTIPLSTIGIIAVMVAP